jgi:hypothetical protein
VGKHGAVAPNCPSGALTAGAAALAVAAPGAWMDAETYHSLTDDVQPHHSDAFPSGMIVPEQFGGAARVTAGPYNFSHAIQPEHPRFGMAEHVDQTVGSLENFRIRGIRSIA